MRLAPTLATACSVLCLVLTPAGGAAAGCAEAAGVDRFAGLDEDGTLRLDGRGAVRLADLRQPEGGPARDAALAWLRGRIGAPLAVRETGPRDRWERLPVRLSPQAADAGDFAEGLVEAGLALVDPSGAEVLCRPELLALEETARDRGLGVWAEDRYKPVAAEAVTRLTERIGRFTLVEGRVRSVGERKQRTYVNFGTDWSSDFTLIVPKRVWTALLGRRIDAAFLRGRTLRMRGILEGWQGVAITVNVPETVELVQGGRGRR